MIENTIIDTLEIENELLKIFDKDLLCFITNKEGTIIHVSQKFCELMGFSHDQVIGENPRIFKSGEHNDAFYKELWDTITNGETWSGEFKNKKYNGSYIWLRGCIIPILDKQGNVAAFTTIRFDVTTEKKLETELTSLQKMNTIGELASNIAHDIRNPLSVITNEIELNKSYFENNESRRKSYERIQRAIDRINHQVLDVLNFVKKQPSNFCTADLSKVLYLAIGDMTFSKNITINYPKNSIQIVCDPNQIETLFVNLILNSINSISDVGQIDIKINEQNDDILIEIQDSGFGIPEDILPRIFDPLFTTRKQGTGLGLAICKNIVDAHNGEISVKNNPTTFTIRLPKNPNK